MERPKITRRLPPNRQKQKRLKIQEPDGTISIALAAASHSAEDDSWRQPRPEDNRSIPVVIAAGSSRHKRTAEGSVSSIASQDFDMSQPPEPAHWFPDLLEALTQDQARNEPMDLPPDSAVDALLDSISVSKRLLPIATFY